jgi:hypothetical protein
MHFDPGPVSRTHFAPPLQGVHCAMPRQKLWPRLVTEQPQPGLVLQVLMRSTHVSCSTVQVP